MLSAGFHRIGHSNHSFESRNEDLSHVVWYERKGESNRYLTAVYGFGRRRADDFAARVLRECGGSLYGYLSTEGPLLRFSFGRLAEWQPNSSIDLCECNREELTQRLANSIRTIITPLVLELKTAKDLLHKLISDEGYFSWSHSNAAIRTAQIVYLGTELEIPRTEIEASLAPFQKQIGADLSKGIAPAWFIDRCLEEARIAI